MYVRAVHIFQYCYFFFFSLLSPLGIHHESPYDCILPHRNSVDSKAPVLAFRQSVDVVRPNLRDLEKYSKNRRYITYLSSNYMDGFLEGSTAYNNNNNVGEEGNKNSNGNGNHNDNSSENETTKKRNSLFKGAFNLRRLMSTRRKNPGGGDGSNDGNDSQDNNRPTTNTGESSRGGGVKDRKYPRRGKQTRVDYIKNLG